MTDLTKDTLPTPESRRPLVAVEVPGLGGTLYVQPISAWDMANLPDDDEKFVGTLLIKSVVYADRSPVWATEEDVLAYPMGDIKPLIQPALKANGITKDAMEEIKGNSPGDPA